MDIELHEDLYKKNEIIEKIDDACRKLEVNKNEKEFIHEVLNIMGWVEEN